MPASVPTRPFPAKIHTSPRWVPDAWTRRGRRPLNAGPAICAIIFLINVCERRREQRRSRGNGGEGIFLMLHHRAAEGQRALLIKMEIRLELRVMRCRDEAVVLVRALGKRQRFPV